MTRVLILGGTAEARSLANLLTAHDGISVVSSLAGRTDNPALPDGETRIGGFGGVEGLATYLRQEDIALLIDATHPFAARISSNATEAAKKANVEIVRIERPPWQAGEGDDWHHVPSLEDAVSILPSNTTVLVTIGRQQLGTFLDRDDIRVVARAIDPPKISVPKTWTVILERPPFSLEQEIALFQTHKIDVLVTKNAGGNDTHHKLLAARALEKPVIIIDRLPKPDVPIYGTIEAFMQSLATDQT